MHATKGQDSVIIYLKNTKQQKVLRIKITASDAPAAFAGSVRRR